jgi:hypothetical protein
MVINTYPSSIFKKVYDCFCLYVSIVTHDLQCLKLTKLVCNFCYVGNYVRFNTYSNLCGITSAMVVNNTNNV